MPALSVSDVQSLQTGLDVLLTNLQSQVKTQVFGESLPIVGTSLSPQAATAALATLQTKVHDALTPLASTGGDSVAVATAVNTALKSAGFNGTVEVINGGEFQLDFSNVSGTAKTTGSVDSALTLPGLDLDITAPAMPKVDAQIDYGLNFFVGLQGGNFYVKPTSAQAVDVDVKVDTAGAKNIGAKLGLLPVSLDLAKQTLLQANIGVGFADGGDGQLDVSELAGNFVSASVISGTATPTFKLHTNFASDIPMPEIASDVSVSWNLAGAQVDGNPGDNANFGAAPTIDFRNVGIDASSFLGGTIGKFANTLLNVAAPVFTVADKLTTEVPDTLGKILKEFGLGGSGPVTLIDILADPSTAQSIKDIATLGQTLKTLASTNAGGNLIDLGGFSFIADTGGHDARDDAADFSNATLAPSDSNLKGNSVVTNLLSSTHAALGNLLTFPILENPGEAFNFLLGKTADLVQFTPDPITFGFNNTSYFPIFTGIFATLNYGANFTLNFGAGYDTSGIVDYANGGYNNPSKLLNGFYLVDTAGNELAFDAHFAAGVAAGIPAVFTVGVEGGLQGTIGLELKDDFGIAGANDGKVSYAELASVNFNPFKAFDANGKISAYLNAYLDSFFYSKSKNLGSVTLFDFNTETQKAEAEPIPQLAHKNGGTVLLNIGPDAGQRLPGADGTLGESILITQEKNTYIVSSPEAKTLLGAHLGSLGGDLSFTAVSFIQGNGGEGDDVLRASQDLKHGIAFFGGNGFDLLQGGAEGDLLDGGADNDRLEGFGGDDTLLAGAGNDNLSGGDGNDSLVGDLGSDVLNGGAGNDLLYAMAVTAANDSALAKNALFGGPGKDQLFGSLGDDVLDGGTGIDKIITNGGHDAVFVDDPKDLVIATGVETNVTIYSRAATFTLPAGFIRLELINDFGEDGGPLVHNPIKAIGNELDNTLIGNLANNNIKGLGGNDTIYGDSDFIDSGNGNFTPFYLGSMYGGGNDILDGGDGSDTIYGGGGDDSLLGSAGDDHLLGEDGDDFLYGGDGNDTLEGGPGNDNYLLENFSVGSDIINDADGFNVGFVITAQTIDLANPAYSGLRGIRFFGAGTAFGTGNAEALTGGAGVNKLYAGGGNDTLEGGDGDFLSGGPGSDTYRVTGLTVKIKELPEPGAIRGDMVITSVNFKLPGEVEDLTTTGDAFLIGVGNELNNHLFAPSKGGAWLYGEDGDDSLTGTFYACRLVGGPGNDGILGSSADDLIYGYIDNTFFSKPDANAPDNDTIFAGPGNDVIFGGPGNDDIEGNEGNDEIHTEGTAGVHLKGGDGDDSYYFDSLDAVFTNGSIDESDTNGNDTVFSIVDVDLRAVFLGNIQVLPEVANVENITLLDFKILSVLHGAVNASGNSLSNTITGNRLANNLNGGAGNDRLFGGDGGDNLFGGDGVDVLDGGNGPDLLDLAELNGFASDLARGGKGNDIYLVDYNQERLFENPNEGYDTVKATVKFTLPPDFERLEVIGPATDGIGNAGANAILGNNLDNGLLGKEGNDTLYGYEGADILDGGPGADHIYGGPGIDSIHGGPGDDFIEGNSAGDHILGGGGNDTIYGHAASLNVPNAPDSIDDNFSDVLYGDGGDDALYGQGGNDSLIGGAGSDTMIGGQGNDSYDVDSLGDAVTEKPSEGDDTVNSSISLTIPANVERLQLKGFLDLSATGSKNSEDLYGNSGNNILKGLAGADSLFGYLGADQLFGGDNIDYLYGDDDAAAGYNDLLDGGAGADHMLGGGGDDIYRVDDLGDVVQELANKGTDTIESTIGCTLPDNVENLAAIGTGKGPVAIDGGKILTGLFLTGNALPNKIIGGDLADRLDGAGGADLLLGGKGGDIYIVDTINDQISELPNEGSDEVRSYSPEYALPENVESLTIQPGIVPSAQNAPYVVGIGNKLANTIHGNEGQNILFGDDGNDFLYGHEGSDILAGGEGDDVLDSGTGADSMQGGPGNDRYTIRDSQATAEEDVNDGYDVAEVFADGWQLGANSFIEEIRMANQGSALSIAGNNLANIIVGNSANNSISGGGGSDTINGGDGNDSIFGTSGAFQPGEIDRLTGGKGADRFYLTDGGSFSYSDSDDTTAGMDSFAYVTDFHPAEGDRLAVRHGDYLLAKTTVVLHDPNNSRLTKSVTGLGFFLDADADGILDLPGTGPVADDLLAFLGGVRPTAHFDIEDIVTHISL